MPKRTQPPAADSAAGTAQQDAASETPGDIACTAPADLSAVTLEGTEFRARDGVLVLPPHLLEAARPFGVQPQ